MCVCTMCFMPTLKVLVKSGYNQSLLIIGASLLARARARADGEGP